VADRPDEGSSSILVRTAKENCDRNTDARWDKA
jgi:hypothetical protein